MEKKIDCSSFSYGKQVVLDAVETRLREVDSFLPALQEKSLAALEAQREDRKKKADAEKERQRKEREWDKAHWFGSNPYELSIWDVMYPDRYEWYQPLESCIYQRWQNIKDELVAIETATKPLDDMAAARLSLDVSNLVFTPIKPPA